MKAPTAMPKPRRSVVVRVLISIMLVCILSMPATTVATYVRAGSVSIKYSEPYSTTYSFNISVVKGWKYRVRVVLVVRSRVQGVALTQSTTNTSMSFNGTKRWTSSKPGSLPSQTANYFHWSCEKLDGRGGSLRSGGSCNVNATSQAWVDIFDCMASTIGPGITDCIHTYKVVSVSPTSTAATNTSLNLSIPFSGTYSAECAQTGDQAGAAQNRIGAKAKVFVETSGTSGSWSTIAQSSVMQLPTQFYAPCKDLGGATVPHPTP